MGGPKDVMTSSPEKSVSVFSSDRVISLESFEAPPGIEFNKRLKMNGKDLLASLQEDAVPVAFFDPQYRGILDKLNYGNEGETRGRKRSSLGQMSKQTIQEFILGISRVLIPSGHLFLWMDKFHLCSGFSDWFAETPLEVVDMITWHKGRMGMGYRSRRSCEYLVVLQKAPQRAKGVWKIHNIPDVWTEEVARDGPTHKKPVKLQAELMSAVSNEGDVIVDPAAGSFSVMEACIQVNRNFLGCDVNG